MIFQFIVLQVIVFGAVIFFLKKILYGDTESAINRLGQTYQDLLKKQKELTEKLETGEKEYQAKKEEASTLAEKAKNQAVEDARKKEEEIIKRARVEAEEIVAKGHAAKAEVAKEIETRLSHKTIDFAAEILGSVFSEKMVALIHEEMVRDFMVRAKDFDLSNASDSANELIVRTPFPLKKEEVEKLNLLLVTKLNRTIQYNEVIDKELIAGIVLQFGTLLLDGCLATSIKEAGNKSREKV